MWSFLMALVEGVFFFDRRAREEQARVREANAKREREAREALEREFDRALEDEGRFR